MKRISKLNRGSELIKHLMATMVVLASLLILPNTHARVGDVFTQDKIQYTVTSEGTLFKSVSLTGHEEGIVTANIPASVVHNGTIYNVTVIDEYAFFGCSNLKSIDIPASVTSIGNWAFSDCSSLTSIIIPDRVTTIGERAFEGCVNLKDVNLGNGLERFGSTVFHHCSALTSIRLPASLKDIGWATFNWCSGIEYFEVDENNPYFTTVDGILFSKSLKRLVKYPAAKEGTEYIVPENVNEIDDYCFHICYKLKKIIIPELCTKISHGMFDECHSLEEFTIPSKVTSIEDWAFGSCNKLKNVIIPNGVLTIGNCAFAKAYELEGINIPASVVSIGNSVFQNQLKYIDVDPDNSHYCSVDNALLTKDMRTLLCQAGYDTYYEIPPSVKYIGDYAFVHHREMKSVTFPEGLEYIGACAFEDCTLLRDVVLPSTLTSLGDGVFQWCPTLSSITFVGNAPELTGNGIFNGTPAIVYYIEGTSGWTNPWCGRPTVSVSTAPTIIAQPSDRTVTEGGSVQFSVGVIGTISFNYQWYKDGRVISEATSASYRIDDVDRSDAGNYFVIVSNEYGTATSEIAVLTVNEGAAPEITVQPINKKAKLGTNVGFSVQASNATSYQWYKNGVAIEGATSRFLELNNVTKEDEGEYFAVAINKSGTAASKVVTLTVMIPPVIIKQPESLSVLEGTEAAFSVEAENATNYQWYKDNSHSLRKGFPQDKRKS